MDTEKTLEATIETMLNAQLKADPQLQPAKLAMKAFFAKYLSYASLKDDLIKLYATEFSEEELKQVTAFYRTPAGKKMVTKLPVLMQKAGELSTKRVQDNTAELRTMIEDALKNPRQ